MQETETEARIRELRAAQERPSVVVATSSIKTEDLLRQLGIPPKIIANPGTS